MVLATANLFVQEGAYVFITGRSQQKLYKAIKEISKNVIGVQDNAGSLAVLDRLFEMVKKDKGRIDGRHLCEHGFLYQALVLVYNEKYPIKRAIYQSLL